MNHGATETARPTAVILGLGLFLLGPVAALAPLGVAPLAIVTGLSLGVIHLRQYRLAALPRTPLAGLLMALSLLGVTSLLWSINPGRTLPAALSLAAIALPGLLLITAAATTADHHARHIENAFLAGFGLGVALLLIQIGLGHSFGELLSRQPLLNHITPKIVSRPTSVFALTIWPAAIILYRRGHQALAWLLPLAYTGATLVIHHRSSTVAMAAGLAVLAMAGRAPALTQRLLAGVLITLFVGAIPIAETLHSLGLEDSGWLPSSARHRVEIWQFTADQALEHLGIGVGLDAAGSISNGDRQSRFQEPGASIIPLHPHNFFLQLWVELGLAGALLGLSIALSLLGATAGLAAAPLQRFALAGFTACWCILALSYGAWQAWWLAAITLAATALAFACGPRPR